MPPTPALKDTQAALRKCAATSRPLHRLHVACLLAVCICKQRVAASDVCLSCMRAHVPDGYHPLFATFRIHFVTRSIACSISRRLQTVIIDGPDAGGEGDTHTQDIGRLACWFQATSM